MPFGLKIAILNREFRRRMDEKAADMGLTSVQLRVLGSVSRLEAAGEEDRFVFGFEKDRRYKKITCTERSVGIHKVILAQDAEVLTDLCRDFTAEQAETLMELMDLLLDRIDPENK